MLAGNLGGLRAVVYRSRRQEESAGSVREGKFFESTGALFGDFPGKAPDCPTGFSGIRVCIQIVVEADKNLFAERAKFVGIAQGQSKNSFATASSAMPPTQRAESFAEGGMADLTSHQATARQGVFTLTPNSANAARLKTFMYF